MAGIERTRMKEPSPPFDLEAIEWRIADQGGSMTVQIESPAVSTPGAGYRLSWIDDLTRWVDRLPGPAWSWYLAGPVALALLTTLVLWVDGSVPVGSYGAIQGVFPPFVFYFIALYHYLTRIGSRALYDFRPLLKVDDAEFERIHHDLITLPRSLGWWAIVVSVVTLPPYFLGGQAFGDRPPHTALPYVIAIAGAGFFGATIFGLIIRSLRQLRMVHKLQTKVTGINLLKLEPAHAFAGLTARTGIGLLVLLILGYLYNPSSFHGAWIVLGYIVMAIPAVVVFVVPIMGMRERLMQEKKRALDETSDLLSATSERLESKIRQQDYADLQGMETAMRALIRKREMLEKISTWPWDTATIRGFASTLLLPIFLWLVTRLLARLV